MARNTVDEDRSGDAALIDALGIGDIVAVTGKKYTAVHNWKQRGIPTDFPIRKAIADLAARKGVTLPAERFPPGVAPPPPLASIFSRLGGHVAVAEGAGIAVTVLERMEADGRIWPQYRRQIVDLAARRGLLLDPDALTLTVFPEHPGAAA